MRRFLLLLAVPLIALAACSSDDDASDVDAGGDTTEASESTATDDAGDSPDTMADADITATSLTTPEEYTSEIYADAAHWLCRPDMTESPCETDLALTVVNEDGTTEVQPHVVAEDPAFDCFYVYPTINMTGGENAPFDGEYGPELGITRTQAARFSSMCNVYAPVYRQITLDGFAADNAEELLEIAYADVADSFKHYLANDNDGRPFVLIGHSQGSGMLSQLMAEEIDDNEAVRSQLISSLIIGSAVSVPAGEDVGGDFDNIPACRSATQTGCVVTFASFRADAPPPEGALFGKPRQGDGVALCTNPVAMGGGSAETVAIFPQINSPWVDGATDVPTIDTPYWSTAGLLSAECVETDGFNYLAVTVNPDPSGPRIDDISGDLSPPWGLHAVDYNVVMGDLLTLVEQQAAAYQAAN